MFLTRNFSVFQRSSLVAQLVENGRHGCGGQERGRVHQSGGQGPQVVEQRGGPEQSVQGEQVGGDYE